MCAMMAWRRVFGGGDAIWDLLADMRMCMAEWLGKEEIVVLTVCRVSDWGCGVSQW
jgi:hypothetical protein